MSERYQFLTVALDKEYSEDYINSLISAIRMLSGVAEVKPIQSESINFGKWSAIIELRERLWEALK